MKHPEELFQVKLNLRLRKINPIEEKNVQGKPCRRAP